MRILRRLSQILIFGIFVFLFLNTEYKDNDILKYAVNVFLRLDPLVAGAAVVAGRALIPLVWPALITVILTLALGRFFCGWFCPLGSVLDFADWTAFRLKKRIGLPDSWRSVKYFILLFLIASSVFTLQFVFMFDPISIIVRSFTVAVYPAANYAVNGTFDALYKTPVAKVSEPALTVFKNHFLAFEQPHFNSAAIIGAVFFGIIGLEYLQRRAWCRNFCPLGALLGLVGRFAIFKRRVSEPDCTSCGRCRRGCRMGAISDDFKTTDRSGCIECLDCSALCPEHAITFIGGKATPVDAGTGITRRGLVYSLALGAVSAPVFMTEGYKKGPDPKLIRPPGALAEDEFLARCTRCGECMRVCIANGLQPTLFEAGLVGLWSPVMVPKVGYCELNCTLCGQVCPTGAIKRLTPDEKRQTKLGLAEFDRSHCIPWKGESDCIVCEEHCPTADKAIKLRETEVITFRGEKKTFKMPYVDEKLCVGCGICENKCPLTDTAGIRVTSRGESRSGQPDGSMYPSGY